MSRFAGIPDTTDAWMNALPWPLQAISIAFLIIVVWRVLVTLRNLFSGRLTRYDGRYWFVILFVFSLSGCGSHKEPALATTSPSDPTIPLNIGKWDTSNNDLLQVPRGY